MPVGPSILLLLLLSCTSLALACTVDDGNNVRCTLVRHLWCCCSKLRTLCGEPGVAKNALRSYAFLQTAGCQPEGLHKSQIYVPMRMEDVQYFSLRSYAPVDVLYRGAAACQMPASATTPGSCLAV